MLRNKRHEKQSGDASIHERSAWWIGDSSGDGRLNCQHCVHQNVRNLLLLRRAWRAQRPLAPRAPNRHGCTHQHCGALSPEKLEHRGSGVRPQALEGWRWEHLRPESPSYRISSKSFSTKPRSPRWNSLMLLSVHDADPSGSAGFLTMLKEWPLINRRQPDPDVTFTNPVAYELFPHLDLRKMQGADPGHYQTPRRSPHHPSFSLTPFGRLTSRLRRTSVPR